MNNSDDARVTIAAAGQPDGEPKKTDMLIKAALALSQAIEALGTLNLSGATSPPDVRRGIDFYDEVRRYETALIIEALRLTHGSQAQSASLLGLNPTTLNCMIKRYGIEVTATAAPTGERRERGRRARRSPPPPIRPREHEFAQP